jgi:hypothetical protein
MNNWTGEPDEHRVMGGRSLLHPRAGLVIGKPCIQGWPGTAVKWVWNKHLHFIPTELPQEVTEFLQDCKGCAEGVCQVLQRMEIDWRANQGSAGDDANWAPAGNQASDRSGSDESSSEESSSLEGSSE